MSSMNANEISDKKMARRALIGSTSGAIIEWYDFSLYAVASALIFPKLFFPDSDPFIATILSFATFATGFLARPIGAIIFGHFGDRIGRKNALIVTLWMMGLSSAAMGLIPSYNSIGIWAPILLVLMRLIQGVGVGGEWAGSILLSMEWGKKNRQGFMASIPNAGVGAGMLLSSAVVGLCITLAGDSFYEWGWRIPFLGSLLLLVVGLIIRSKIIETPSFRKVQEGETVSKLPIVDVMKHYPKQVFFTGLAKLAEHTPFAIYTTFLINYSINNFHVSSSFMVNANTVASFLLCILIPFFGYLSDKVGIKRLFMMGIAVTFVWGFVFVGLVDTGVSAVIAAVMLISMIPFCMQTGALPALASQAFPARLRYSGASLGTQIPAIFGGGIAPMVCTYLIQATGTIYSIGIYIAIVSILGFIGTSKLKSFSSEHMDSISASNESGLTVSTPKEIKA
ncbi:MFS transporter [Metabacillus arenae]|uniref:Putative proline/betaine transporter n=1 Tax=Metabacillus arenae TaxID=2771434 RepID=A0A926S442_9BACI|nr:MFS transporter [Metabacillus arenae]MBD1383599.1 MHS family MFS transporter [Metabacillus arenae]